MKIINLSDKGIITSNFVVCNKNPYILQKNCKYYLCRIFLDELDHL